MSGTLVEEPPVINDPAERNPARRMQPVRSRRRASLSVGSTRALAGLVFVAGLVFWYFCNRPLGLHDVWGDVVYGRTIWELKSLPLSEPLMPLAQGMPLVDTSWLNELIAFRVMSLTGIAGLKCLYAAFIAVSVALLVWSAYRSSRNGTVAAYAVLTFFVVAGESLATVNAQLAGLVCFVALLARMTNRRARAGDWLLVPALFAVWANLHASVVVGLFLLLCFAAGRALDVMRRTGSLTLTVCDTRARRNFLLLELAAVAVLLNPYGLGLYAELLSYGSNPNLRDLTDWRPLTLQTFGGQMFAVVVVLLAMIYRWSPRRVRSWEVLALAGFGVASMWSGGNLIWWAPLAALLVAQHVHSLTRAVQHLPFVSKPAPRRVVWSVVIAGIVCACLAYSPLGGRLRTGKEAEFKRTVTDDTPVAAAEFLTANPPQGQIFNTHEWGDYLQWAGPPGIKVFATSHAHLVPIDVWQRYQQILDQRGNWEEVLDRFAVNTIVLDTRQHGPLVAKLKHQVDVWGLAFEQDGQVVLTRRKPL
jgi:multisubunit Na+/H+ antiporter MnhB subunit